MGGTLGQITTPQKKKPSNAQNIILLIACVKKIYIKEIILLLHCVTTD